MIRRIDDVVIPNESIFGFVFGENVDLYSCLKKIDAESDENWITYSPIGDDDVRIYSKNNIIVSVGVYRQCNLNGKNIFGISKNEAAVIFENYEIQPDVQDILDDVQDIFRIDELGLLIWFKDDCSVAIQFGSPL